jgi:UPF0716 protein FxsA
MVPRYVRGVARLFLLFTIVPLLDLFILLRVAAVVGPWGTVALIIVPSLLGAWLARREGLRVLRAWQRAIADGRVPEEGLLSAGLVLAGGVLLATPGLLTDATGLALLVPPIRRVAVAGVRRWLRRRMRDGTIRVVTSRLEHPDEPIDVTPRR